EEQPDQRRSADQALPECVELHLRAQQRESDTDQAEDVAVGEMRAEGQAGDLDVEAPDGQVVDFYRLYGHVNLQLLLFKEKPMLFRRSEPVRDEGITFNIDVD